MHVKFLDHFLLFWRTTRTERKQKNQAETTSQSGAHQESDSQEFDEIPQRRPMVHTAMPLLFLNNHMSETLWRHQLS